MGGPGASVLTNKPKPIILTAVGRVLNHQTCSRIEVDSPGGFDTNVNDTRPIGGHYLGEGEPFLVEVQPAGEYDEPENWRTNAQSIHEYFGVQPIHDLSIVAMCTGRHNDRILAELSIVLAQLLDGVIDLNGAILPPRCQTVATLGNGSWEDVRADFEEWVRPMPGGILALPHMTARGAIWTRHVVDVEFLSAYMRLPDFRMVK